MENRHKGGGLLGSGVAVAETLRRAETLKGKAGAGAGDKGLGLLC